MNRSGPVTLRSTSGTSATLSSLQIGASRYIRVANVTLNYVQINNCSRDISIVDSVFVQDGSGIGIENRDFSCSAGSYPANILISGNDLSGVNYASGEGQIGVTDACGNGGGNNWGVVITYNILGNTNPGAGIGSGDAIQAWDCTKGVQIGPGNIIENVGNSGGSHFDGIQFFGGGSANSIIGNWFRNLPGCCALTHHTAVPSGTNFSNNILTNVASYQVDQSPSFIDDHNTWYNDPDIAVCTAGGGSVVNRSNLVIGGSGFRGGGQTGCTVPGDWSYTLCASGISCPGSNTVVGSPTFVGGSPGSIVTWGGWKLAAGSIGKANGHDGRDRGANFFSPAAPIGFAH